MGSKVTLLGGITYDNITVQVGLFICDKWLSEGIKRNVFFLNADCLYQAQTNIEYRNILNNQCDLLLSDGVGIRLITKYYHSVMNDNCNGSDFSPKLLKASAEKGLGVFLLGGIEGVAEAASHNLKNDIPNLKIVGTNSGYFEDSESVIDKINTSGASILLVGFGVPLQEKWITENRNKLSPTLCLGIGALFDYYSGNVKRAPKIIQKIQLEWFWRMLIDPKRLVKRYLFDGSKLILKVLLSNREFK